MNVNKLPDNMREDLHNRGYTDDGIAIMTWEECFDEWLHYRGLFGWSRVLRETITAMQEADKT